MMNDEKAQAAHDAYRALLLRYRSPSIAPELVRITQDLQAAAAYFDAIRFDQMTLPQRRLAARIDQLLLTKRYQCH